ncbi:MAG: efflux RND transporter periplasmic adaptor subunit [Nevskia sp.]|nr:efflux RND transporter periplasmic adaptor subunit [Nevskia sp.]
MNSEGDSPGLAPAGVDDDGRRSISPGRLKVAGIIAAAVAAVVVVGGIVSRRADDAAVVEWTRAQAIPSVSVIKPSTAGVGGAIVLPGRVEAFYRAPIYARVSGYLKTWYTDIGSRVKSGQVLAEIETPDLDQQLAQARAELATARANESLAEISAKRWQLMLKADSVSQQAADEKTGDLEAKRAVRGAAEANVQKLQAMEGFKRIVAPFDGVVTARTTDVGALINAGSGVGPQLFTVSDIHRLRVYVSVPQDESASIRPDMTARLSVPERPDRTFTATVTNIAGAVNVESGTVLVELMLGDTGGAVQPGDYAQVELDLPAEPNVVRIPATALVFKSKGLQVATVNANDRVSLRPIAVKRDLGSAVEVASGVGPDDRVIDNPPESLQDGEEVQLAGADGGQATGGGGEPAHEAH